ncbi:MAG: biotin--[Lachnospiraceae bacterium]|nr:biotin--[acetyl-CoA-carboxylase] ligase [Lachnospiraceae bacterium]
MRLNNTLFQIPIINNVLYYDTIDSTNNKAKELAKRGSVHGSLVVAKSQTAGRGRMGRSFSSADNQGLYFSLMLRPNVSMNHLSSITLVTALAVSTALDTICNINTTIKWPNDVYINNKKAVGILTEAGPDYVVIGIGINVNTKEFPSD